MLVLVLVVVLLVLVLLVLVQPPCPALLGGCHYCCPGGCRGEGEGFPLHLLVLLLVTCGEVEGGSARIGGAPIVREERGVPCCVCHANTGPGDATLGPVPVPVPAWGMAR